MRGMLTLSISLPQSPAHYNNNKPPLLHINTTLRVPPTHPPCAWPPRSKVVKVMPAIVSSSDATTGKRITTSPSQHRPLQHPTAHEETHTHTHTHISEEHILLFHSQLKSQHQEAGFWLYQATVARQIWDSAEAASTYLDVKLERAVPICHL